jgi:hypothetical protein
MARDLLRNPLPGVIVDHIYAYELESWLYILLHICLGYTNVAPDGDPLKAWRSSDWSYAANFKGLFLSADESGYISVMDSVRNPSSSTFDVFW